MYFCPRKYLLIVLSIMNLVCNSFIYVQPQNDTSTWLIIIVIGMVLVLLIAALVFQWHDKNRTLAEISHLASTHRHGVEHELVLKAMKLATWRIELATMTFTYDADFRARTDLMTPPPGCSFDYILNAINPNDVQRVRDGLDALYKGDYADVHVQYRMKSPHQDKEYWLETYATVAERDDNGKPLVIIGTNSCIDDVKRMEQDLVDARNKAEESDRLKTSFINNISHEIRTPLNAIVGFSDILPSITNEKERKELISIIKENNQKLLDIFEEMMEISKAEAADDKTKLNVSDFDAVVMLRNIVEEFKRKNINPAIDLGLQIIPSKCMLHTDFGRLREVVAHYMSNAFKFTEKGSISVLMEESDNSHIRISVTDTGKGVPEKDYDRIFDRFVKVDNFVQGAGLGLSVCRSYAYSLGGTVGVKSKVGEGSTFWIDIPTVL